MSKEIESKIMNMTVRELFERAEHAGIDIGIGWSGKVIDEYWLMPSVNSVMSSFDMIRYRREYDGETGGKKSDLTIKGAEDNDGKFTSERSEYILSLDTEADSNQVMLFLKVLGGAPRHRIEKNRIKIETPDNKGIRIHHDTVCRGINHLEWVEIEADSLDELHETIFKLLGSEEKARARVTNLSTLDLCGVGKNRHLATRL